MSKLVRKFSDQQVLEQLHVSPRTVVSKLIEAKATDDDIASVILADASVQLMSLIKFKVNGRLEYDPTRHDPINYIEADLSHMLTMASRIIEEKKKDEFGTEENDLS